VISPRSDHFLGNRRYSQLKFIAQIFLPTLGSLYFGLAALLDLPVVATVMGTILVIDACVGLFLCFSAWTYNRSRSAYDGTIQMGAIDGDHRSFHLELPISAEVIENSKQIVLKVNRA